MPATTGMPCNSHSAVIVEMMITLAPRMKPHSRIKVTIRMTYGFHHVSSLIALIMLRCGGLDIRLPQPRTQPTKTAEASYVLDISVQGGRCNRSITVWERKVT